MKTVTFAKSRTVRVVPKIDTSFKQALWWNHEELGNIRLRCLHVIVEATEGEEANTTSSSAAAPPSIAISKQKDIDSTTTRCCLRGLESWILDGAYQQRQRRIQEARICVMEQQAYRQSYGIESPSASASIYAEITVVATELAQQRGLEDANAASDILMNDHLELLIREQDRVYKQLEAILQQPSLRSFKQRSLVRQIETPSPDDSDQETTTSSRALMENRISLLKKEQEFPTRKP